jgi:transposase-like protein
MVNMKAPKTLQQAVVMFSNPDDALAYAIKLRWPEGVTCPRCGSKESRFVKTRRLWFCKGCQKQFTIKVGTIFEDSAVDIGKWMIAYWMLLNCKNGVSSYEVAKAIGVTQKTAWFILHRLRLAMQDTAHGGGKLGGPGSRVEVDETFIGGKARNMHVRKRMALGKMTGGEGKTVVLGMLERGGKVRTRVVPNREGVTLQPIIREHVKGGAKIMSDEHAGYNGLEDEFLRGVVNHAVTYVDGQVHTNGMENYWSLVKRGLNGTYVAVEPFHLFRYLDEQAFRYNNRKAGDRKLTDSERFELGMSQVSGKRLTFDTLTGKGDNQREVF